MPYRPPMGLLSVACILGLMCMDLRNKTTENFSTVLPYLALIRQLGLDVNLCECRVVQIAKQAKSILVNRS